MLELINKTAVYAQDDDSNIHCKPRQVEPAYIECGNGAVAMQVGQVNLLEMGPT